MSYPNVSLGSMSSPSPRNQVASSSSTRQQLLPLLNRAMPIIVQRTLADGLFASSRKPAEVVNPQSVPQTAQKQAAPATKPKIAERMREFSQQSPLMHQPTPMRPNPNYKSTAVGSSPPPPAVRSEKPKTAEKPEYKMPEISKRPIWKVPDHSRSTSVPRAFDAPNAASETIQPQLQPPKRPTILDSFRSKSHTSTASMKSPTSSRPSLEGHRPSQLEIDDSSITRAHSAQQRQRPSSAYVSSIWSSYEIKRLLARLRSRLDGPWTR